MLPEVVAAVNGRATVIVDGAFMRGTDVVKAIALGAQAVGLGRLSCCGLAAAGQAGLVRVFELLEEEIRICLGLLGVNRLSALDSSYLHPAAPVRPVDEPDSLAGSETILLVEDDDRVRTAVKRFLIPYGYKVLEARPVD